MYQIRIKREHYYNYRKKRNKIINSVVLYENDNLSELKIWLKNLIRAISTKNYYIYDLATRKTIK